MLVPLWWALGLASFIFPIVAAVQPMALELRRRRPVKVPPWFWIWAPFLGLDGCHQLWRCSPGARRARYRGHRPAAASSPLTGVSPAEYARGDDHTAVHVGNLTASWRCRSGGLISWLSVLFMVTVLGGFLGTYVPAFQFTSPPERMLPSGRDGAPTSAVHAALAQTRNAAQIQAVHGQRRA